MVNDLSIPIDVERLYNLLKEMVDIYSPSGKEEELTEYLFEFLREHLEPHGCRVMLQPVDESRSNILVETPPGDTAGIIPPTDVTEQPYTRLATSMLFLGHIDTVPAYDIENYRLRDHKGNLRGLGTSDMKSGCAAMIEAFCSAALSGSLPPRAMLALVVGEEESGDGTQALLREYQFESALVAEPSGLQPCISHFGYVEMLLRTFGYRRHAAMSDRDTNAIRAMLRYLLQLEDRIEQYEENTVLNIRDISSSESGFAVPDRCSASIDIHVPPDVDTADYALDMRDFSQGTIEANGCTTYEIDFPTVASGYTLTENDSVHKLLQNVFSHMDREWDPAAFASHSDANLLFDAGCRPIILGPGELAKAHTRDESVEFSQVTDAAMIYLSLLEQLADPEAPGLAGNS